MVGVALGVAAVLEQEALRAHAPGELADEADPAAGEPDGGERVENARERIRELQPVPDNRGRERYQRMVARLGGRSPASPAK